MSRQDWGRTPPPHGHHSLSRDRGMRNTSGGGPKPAHSVFAPSAPSPSGLASALPGVKALLGNTLPLAPPAADPWQARTPASVHEFWSEGYSVGHLRWGRTNEDGDCLVPTSKALPEVKPELILLHNNAR